LAGLHPHASLPTANRPQDLQRDLRTAQQQRDLTEAEAAQLAAVNTRLSAENADLSAASSSLRAENEALGARADSLLERQAALEAAAESLKLENCTLLQQFDRLKIKYEQDAAGFQEQVAELKSSVSGALQRFTSGDISADQLLAFLGAMGVELRCRWACGRVGW
jgi:chromosome segregation ATPase